MDKESTAKARAFRAYNGTHFQNSPSVILYDIKVNIVDLLGDQQRVP
ncbi:MAG: hypothetical protein HOK17_01315 [Flammeovirgaceae bacterium]|jgi:hypothetical protein|nr:hypothetical protein [Flammeovirgaceae bacterium]